MATPDLGKLEKITNLREGWETEAGHFTPWLAKPENIALLSDALELEIEVEAQEKNVGPFKADLLCKNLSAEDSWILIENQLERTDHTHLGQLLTYAAGLKAVTIVWIAETFTEEHRAALDWLNEITDHKFNFFGLEIELWRIGNSPIAPKFNVVCKPNDWTKTVSGAVKQIESAQLTETRLLQREYWSGLRQMLLDSRSPLKPQKPLPQSWTNFAIGRASFHLSAAVNSRDKFIYLLLIMEGPNAKAHFHLLDSDKKNIEAEAGSSLEWRELSDKQVSQIMIRLNDADPTNKDDWNRQHQWFKEKLELFQKVFAARIKNLTVEDTSTASDAS